MKTVKFAPHLVAMIQQGTKTTTWRLFDDKDLQLGDSVQLTNKETLAAFGTARIADVRVKTLAEVADHELEEHGYANCDAMYENLRTYYGDRVTPSTEVKMLTFESIECAG